MSWVRQATINAPISTIYHSAGLFIVHVNLRYHVNTVMGLTYSVSVDFH
jgi:hypothetical protein